MFNYHNQNNNLPTPFCIISFIYYYVAQTHEFNKIHDQKYDPKSMTPQRYSNQPYESKVLRERNDRNDRNYAQKSPKVVDDYSYQRTRSRIEELQGIIDEIQGGRNRTPELRDYNNKQTPKEGTPNKILTISPMYSHKYDDISTNNPNNMETWLNFKDAVHTQTSQINLMSAKQVNERSRMITPPLIDDSQKYSDLFSRYIHRYNKTNTNTKPLSPKFNGTDVNKYSHSPLQSKKPPQTAQPYVRQMNNENPIVADFELQINQFIHIPIEQNTQRQDLSPRCLDHSTVRIRPSLPPNTTNYHNYLQPQQKTETPKAKATPMTKTTQINLKNENSNIPQSIIASVLPDSMILDNLDNFQLGKVLGLGSYAVVRLSVHKPTAQRMAIKTYEKSKLGDPQKKKNVTREMKILSKLRHPCIIKLYQASETSSQLHLIMEYSSSNSLNTYIKTKPNRRLCENETRIIIRQIVDAIRYCHHKNVVHRDIKLENILVDDRQGIKLIDFGFSIAIDPATKLNVFCGTPSYMAPEIVNKVQYSFPADIWALGILLFKMVTGAFPFRGQDDKELYRKINSGKMEYPVQIGNQLKTLIQKLLSVQEADRPTAKDILLDEWFYIKSNSMEEEPSLFI